MDNLSQRSLITPTTCISVACVALSLLALSAVWREHRNSSQLTTLKEPTTTAQKTSRPHPTRRVATTGSICAKRNDEACTVKKSLHPFDVPIEPTILPAASLTELSALSSRIFQKMQHGNGVVLSRWTATAALGELSIVTTDLLQLRKQLAYSTLWFTQGSGIAACFETCMNGLRETLALLDTELSDPSDGQNDAIETLVQRIQDQRPTLEFLLESSSTNLLPPTPPADADSPAMEKTLQS